MCIFAHISHGYCNWETSLLSGSMPQLNPFGCLVLFCQRIQDVWTPICLSGKRKALVWHFSKILKLLYLATESEGFLIKKIDIVFYDFKFEGFHPSTKIMMMLVIEFHIWHLIFECRLSWFLNGSTIWSFCYSNTSLEMRYSKAIAYISECNFDFCAKRSGFTPNH